MHSQESSSQPVRVLKPLHCIQDVLLKSVDDWREALDRDEVTAAVFIDLSKAFDMIDHGLLLRKLEMYGVRDGESTWFRNYLNDIGGREL